MLHDPLRAVANCHRHLHGLADNRVLDDKFSSRDHVWGHFEDQLEETREELRTPHAGIHGRHWVQFCALIAHNPLTISPFVTELRSILSKWVSPKHYASFSGGKSDSPPE